MWRYWEPPLPSLWGPPWHTGVPHAGGVTPADTPGRCDQANSSRAQEDLESEFQSLYALLDELKDQMLMKIKQDRASRTYELQVSVPPACPPPSSGTLTHRCPSPSPRQAQLAACAKALESSEELLEAANQALGTANHHDFPQVCPHRRGGVVPVWLPTTLGVS